MALIYHYCSPHAFHQIVENKCFWLSSTKNMNDFSEGAWVRDSLHKAIEKLRLTFGLDWADQVLKNYDEISLQKYICCFSKRGDALSQWRAYAQDGEGVSIGIDVNAFGINVPSLSAHKDPLKSLAIKNVEYMDEIDVFQKILNHAKQTIKSDEYYKNSAYVLAKYCADRSTFIKNPAFIEEEEKRVIFSYGEGFPCSSDEISDSNNAISELKFRVFSGYLTSYFDFVFPENTIKEIVLGPKNKFSPYDLELFLRHKSLWDVEVKRSSATYR